MPKITIINYNPFSELQHQFSQDTRQYAVDISSTPQLPSSNFQSLGMACFRASHPLPIFSNSLFLAASHPQPKESTSPNNYEHAIFAMGTIAQIPTETTIIKFRNTQSYITFTAKVMIEIYLHLNVNVLTFTLLSDKK